MSEYCQKRNDANICYDEVCHCGLDDICKAPAICQTQSRQPAPDSYATKCVIGKLFVSII